MSGQIYACRPSMGNVLMSSRTACRFNHRGEGGL